MDTNQLDDMPDLSPRGKSDDADSDSNDDDDDYHGGSAHIHAGDDDDYHDCSADIGFNDCSFETAKPNDGADDFNPMM